MQVMPFWIKVIGRGDDNLFHLRTNLRYGCTILRHYLDIERGDITRALLRYNGSLVKGSDYADKVIRNWHTRWRIDAPAAAVTPVRTTTPATAATPAAAIRIRAEHPVRAVPRPAPSAPVTYMGPAS